MLSQASSHNVLSSILENTRTTFRRNFSEMVSFSIRSAIRTAVKASTSKDLAVVDAEFRDKWDEVRWFIASMTRSFGSLDLRNA
jgi:hypothetical protein